MMVKTLTRMSLVSLTALGFAACNLTPGSSEKSNISQTTYGDPLQYMKVDINAHPIDKTVCDPFNATPATDLEQGVKASLFYLQPGMTPLHSALDFPASAIASQQTLFFADLNVWTRPFSEGFTTKANDYLKDDTGQKLIENFGVQFETVLKLTDTDEEGSYEFALLSDDGSVMKIGDGDNQEVLIDNDGDHETKLGCSTHTVNLTRDSALSVKINYYQGPRYHIANMLLWRKSTTAGKDSLCGQRGNYLFFNPDWDYHPQQAYNDLMSRGWKVVPAVNFHIPASASYNPCVAGTAPVISGFKTLEVTSQSVFLSWSTDIPATSQVKLVNQTTGEIILTDSDNALRTLHSIQVNGLQPATTYTAQAVSISADLGSSLGSVITFTTP